MSSSMGQKIKVLEIDVDDRRPGHLGRIRHVDDMRAGVPAYAVVCTSLDTVKHAHHSHEENYLLELGALSQKTNNIYAEIVRLVPIDEFLRTRSGSSTLKEDMIEIIQNLDFKADADEDNNCDDEIDSGTERATTKRKLMDARLGQGGFKDELVEKWGGCCAVSGCSTMAVLRASHIKPWADSNNKERLDSNNGLLLIATLDALFDRFHITFTDEGEMLISKHISKEECRLLGLSGVLRRKPKGRQVLYLADHRNRFHKKEAELSTALSRE